jgi:hypothetical protein
MHSIDLDHMKDRLSRRRQAAKTSKITGEPDDVGRLLAELVDAAGMLPSLGDERVRIVDNGDGESSTQCRCCRAFVLFCSVDDIVLFHIG